jgi:hypothetical protein
MLRNLLWSYVQGSSLIVCEGLGDWLIEKVLRIYDSRSINTHVIIYIGSDKVGFTELRIGMSLLGELKIYFTFIMMMGMSLLGELKIYFHYDDGEFTVQHANTQS